MAAYEASWTSWPIEMQKDLLIVIRVAQKPLSLSAGGVVTMSMQAYSQVWFNNKCYIASFCKTQPILKQVIFISISHFSILFPMQTRMNYIICIVIFTGVIQWLFHICCSQ